MLKHCRCNTLEVVGYIDANFRGCTDDMKSTSGSIFMLAGGARPGINVTKSITASSVMHAYFGTCHKATLQVIWFQNFVIGLKVIDSIPWLTRVYCDKAVF